MTETGADNTNTIFPREYLSSITCSGLPPSILKLKKGVSLIILRNLNIKNSLYNKTRYILLDLIRTQLKVRLISKDKKSQIHFILRIKFHSFEKHIRF